MIMARVLGIDYGTKKVGLAVTDPLQIICSPLTTVPTREIFDFKETCFDKYPGNWRKGKGNSCVLANCAKFEEYKSIDYLTLSSLPFTEKNDVKT